MWGVYTKSFGGWVMRLRFSDSGVSAEMTKYEACAARTESLLQAEALAKLVPGGAVLKHSGAKPSTLAHVEEMNRA